MSGSFSLLRIIRAIADAMSSAAPPAKLCVVGAASELARVVGALSAGAVDERDGVSGGIDALTFADFPREGRLVGRWDIVVFVAAGCAAERAAPHVRAVRLAGRQVVGLVEPGVDAGWAERAGFTAGEVARGIGRGSPTLENLIVRSARDAAADLAVRLPALRRAYCDRVVLASAAQNAAIGVAIIIPGADMPAMTANQIRMVLKIAAAYGEEIGLDRAVEILSIVGGAFVFRTLVRQALGFVPGFGWALKGSVGFAATAVLGQAAIAYFEAGAPLRVSRMQRINRQLERARSRLPGALQRGFSIG